MYILLLTFFQIQMQVFLFRLLVYLQLYHLKLYNLFLIKYLQIVFLFKDFVSIIYGGVIFILYVSTQIPSSRNWQTSSSSPISSYLYLAGLTSNCLHLYFFSWGFSPGYMCSMMEKPGNALFGALHPQPVSTNNWK